MVESVQAGVMLFDMYTTFDSGTIDAKATNPYLLGICVAVCPLLGTSVWSLPLEGLEYNSTIMTRQFR